MQVDFSLACQALARTAAELVIDLPRIVAAIAVTTLVAATVAFATFTGGVLLLLTNPFQLGDQIIVDTFEGTVEQIQTRATLIRAYDNRSVVLPNSDLFTKSVTVNTAYATRRMMYDLTLAAGADVSSAARIVTDVLTHGAIEGVSEDPVADVLLLRIGSTTTLRLLWWSGSERGEYLVVQDRALKAVGATLAKAGVALA